MWQKVYLEHQSQLNYLMKVIKYQVKIQLLEIQFYMEQHLENFMLLDKLVIDLQLEIQEQFQLLKDAILMDVNI